MDQLVTKDDLTRFRVDLVDELRLLLVSRNPAPKRKWLKSHEVRRLLTISPSTLQNLRLNGSLPFIKIGGVMYYDYDDIEQMLERNKTTFRRSPGNESNAG